MALTTLTNEPALQRKCLREDTFSIDDDIATCTALNIAGMAAGTLFLSSDIQSATLLTFYTCDDPAGTYLAVYDSTGSAVTVTPTASTALEIPAACFGAPWLKIFRNATGTIITGSRVTLKG